MGKILTILKLYIYKFIILVTFLVINLFTDMAIFTLKHIWT